MIEHARAFTAEQDGPAMRLAVSSGLRPLPAWKREADALYAQVSFAVEPLLEWRASIDFDGPVYAGVMVVASPTMARKLSADIPQLAVPSDVVEALEHDRAAGVDLACELVAEVEDSGAFDGVHLIPVGRYREVAARLEATRSGSS
jgi:5,10-methylenetetrahydrofolate reductase